MRDYIRRHALLSMLGLFIAGCAVITVNIYFPTEAVQKAAEEILNEIEGEEEVLPGNPIESLSPQSYLIPNIRNFVLGSQIAYASGDIDINLTTPAIRKVIASMKSRNSIIDTFKKKGAIGETFHGKLEIRDYEGLGGSEIRTIKQLVKAENSDRNLLYKELADANDISASDINRIGAVFGITHKNRLESGEWFKGDDGQWSKK